MQAEFALGPAPCEALAIDAGNAASHAARRAAHADDDEALMSNYPTPESTADPADPDADSNGEDLEASIEDEGFVAKRPERRSLRPRRSAAPLLAPASAPRARPTGTAPSAKRDLHQRAPTRHSPRVAAKHDDLDEVADIVEIEDADAVDVLVAQGRSVGSERRRYRLLSKKVTHLSKPGKIVRARPVVGAGVVSVKKPAKPRTPSSFAAAAVEIYKPPQRTFHVRHHRTNKAAPGIMNIEEMTRLISPLASQSQLPSPPPDTTVDTSSDPRRYCTHLRKCWNEATLIEFDARGYVSSPPEARELFRDEGLRCIRHVLPPQRCHTLHAEILSLLPLSMVTSWRGMGAGGVSQKFLWLTEQQILRFGLEYRFDRHRPMPESQHQRFVDRIQKVFGKDFEGPQIALQPNFQQADFPLHTDQPSLEGFGNKIITIGVFGEGWVVIRDKDARRAFKFKVGTGDAWAMVGKARWEWAHGVLCETYPSDMDDPEQQPNPDEPQKFKARRVSLNIRIQ